MSLRKVATVESSDATRRAVVYRESEWNEFRVCFTLNGIAQRRADYFTDDKADAFGTARLMCNLPPLKG